MSRWETQPLMMWHFFSKQLSVYSRRTSDSIFWQTNPFCTVLYCMLSSDSLCERLSWPSSHNTTRPETVSSCRVSWCELCVWHWTKRQCKWIVNSTDRLVTGWWRQSAARWSARWTREARRLLTHPAGSAAGQHTHTHVNQAHSLHPPASSRLHPLTLESADDRALALYSSAMNWQISEFRKNYIHSVDSMKKIAPIYPSGVIINQPMFGRENVYKIQNWYFIHLQVLFMCTTTVIHCYFTAALQCHCHLWHYDWWHVSRIKLRRVVARWHTSSSSAAWRHHVIIHHSLECHWCLYIHSTMYVTTRNDNRQLQQQWRKHYSEQRQQTMMMALSRRLTWTT